MGTKRSARSSASVAVRSRRTLFCCRAATPAKPNRGCDGAFVPVFVCPIYDDLLRNDPCVQQIVNWFSWSKRLSVFASGRAVLDREMNMNLSYSLPQPE